MDEHRTEPLQPGQPSQSQAPYVPPAGTTPPPPGYGYLGPNVPLYGGPAHPAPQPRGRGGWLAAVVIGVFLLMFACVGIVALGAIGSGDGFATGDAVAVIPIDGEIMGSMGGGLLGGGGVTPEGLITRLRKADRDERVKAVLLRVDSPGGTASASEEIAMEVARMEKPVVVSVGDVGASGAYMIASQSDRIVASPLSAVGSIGVILQVPDYRGLADKVGVKYRIFTEGEFKDAGSPFRELTATETVMIQKDLRVAYDEFVDLVAKGRGMKRDKVLKLANGWVWSGRQAKDLGLVDELGNYSDALRTAADLGGIEGEPEVVTYEQTSWQELLESLPQALGGLTPDAVGGLRDVPVAR